MAGVGTEVGMPVSFDVGWNLGTFPPWLGSTYDSDALAYFTAVETAGGSFDLTGIDPTYTESYIKTAHSNFYAGLKTDGVWDKLTEFYLLAGKTFGGLTVKGKGTGSLTNNNFVTGDWLGAGSGAGLAGDGSTKYLDTGLLQSAIPANDSHLGAYLTDATAGTNDAIVGAESGGNNDRLYLGTGATATELYFTDEDRWESINNDPGYGNGMLIGTKNSSDEYLYTNGAELTTEAKSGTDRTPYGGNLFAFALNSGGIPTGHLASTITFAHVGTGLTDTDASNLSTRVNTLMTALGCNTY